MKLDVPRIKQLIDGGYITKRKHNELDLYILNYTSKTQYASAWEPMTEQCRGLIVDAKWKVIANVFPKFYNLNERLTVEELPDEIPVICEKLDGFLTILYPENELPALATRGSFTSDMAVWGTKWLRNTGLVMDDFLPTHTYLFETIEPTLCRAQHLLIDYHDRAECVLLAVRNTDTGEEINHITEANRLNLPFAMRYLGTLEYAVEEMPTMNGALKEGYVVKYSNGLRIKLKCDEYKKLHRILSGATPKRILSTMIESGKEGLDEMFVDIPDESYKRVKDIIAAIEDEQNRIVDEAMDVYNNVKDLPTKRAQSEVISQSPYKSVAFAILNNGNYQMIALKQVRKTLKDIVEMNDQ